MSAIPTTDLELVKKKKHLDGGEVSSPINPLPGCRFRNRCKYSKKICSEAMPKMKKVGNNHYIACHLY
jgi:oligopeptide transport system ATP-binding protein